MAKLDEVSDSEATGSSNGKSIRNRKAKHQYSSIPLTHPSAVREHPTQGLDQHAQEGYGGLSEDDFLEEDDPDLRINESEDENDSDMPVETISSMLHDRAHKRQAEPPDPREDEWFNMIIMTVPFVFLFILLDVLVHMQYNHRAKSPEVAGRVMRAAPTLGAIVFFTNRHPNHWSSRIFLLASCILCGCRLIWLMNKASWGVVTAQAPAMGTLWILSVVQLPLGRCVLGLAAVAGWAWYSGMKVSP